MKNPPRERPVKDERDEMIDRDARNWSLELMICATQVLTIICAVKGNSAWKGSLSLLFFDVAAALIRAGHGRRAAGKAQRAGIARLSAGVGEEYGPVEHGVKAALRVLEREHARAAFLQVAVRKVQACGHGGKASLSPAARRRVLHHYTIFWPPRPGKAEFSLCVFPLPPRNGIMEAAPQRQG